MFRSIFGIFQHNNNRDQHLPTIIELHEVDSSTAAASIQLLPIDIVKEILQKLDAQSICSVSQLNQAYHEFVSACLQSNPSFSLAITKHMQCNEAISSYKMKLLQKEKELTRFLLLENISFGLGIAGICIPFAFMLWETVHGFYFYNDEQIKEYRQRLTWVPIPSISLIILAVLVYIVGYWAYDRDQQQVETDLAKASKEKDQIFNNLKRYTESVDFTKTSTQTLIRL